MPIKSHACVSVHCDVCGEHLGLEDEAHFATEDEARKTAATYLWHITADGRVICPDDIRAQLDAATT